MIQIEIDGSGDCGVHGEDAIIAQSTAEIAEGRDAAEARGIVGRDAVRDGFEDEVRVGMNEERHGEAWPRSAGR